MHPLAALASAEPDRLRQLEIERRIRPVQALVALSLWFGLGLLALTSPPQRIFETLAIGAAYMPLLVLADLRARRSRYSLLWLAAQEVGLIAILGFVLTWSDGLNSPALPMAMLVAMVMGVRYPLPWLIPLLLTNSAILIGACVIGDLALMGADPVRVLAWLAVFNGASLICAMLSTAERHARSDAVFDALTRTLNRQALNVRLARSGTGDALATLSVAVVDLDGFKEVNDAHGHEAGDDVLRAATAVMRSALRGSDLLYRLGGDEFVVVLEGTAPREAATLAERLRTMIERARPAGYAVTASIGVAGVAGEPADLESLIARADRALYEAKAHGRNCVRVDAEHPAAAPPRADKWHPPVPAGEPEPQLVDTRAV